MTGLTNKRDEWKHECPDNNLSDKTQSFGNDVRLPMKNSETGGWEGPGEDVAEKETCCEFLEPVWRFRARLMDGRRTRIFGALRCCLFTGKLGELGNVSAKETAKRIAARNEVRVKRRREGNWRGTFLLHAY